MSKTDQQTAQEDVKRDSQQEKAASEKHYEDTDPVTVIWKSWGTSGMPANKTTYFDKHMFEGGVGRRIPYGTAKKWQAQGHGILIFDVDATDEHFIRATGHKPLEDDKFAMLLKATPPDKLIDLLGGPEKVSELLKK